MNAKRTEISSRLSRTMLPNRCRYHRRMLATKGHSPNVQASQRGSHRCCELMRASHDRGVGEPQRLEGGRRWRGVLSAPPTSTTNSFRAVASGCQAEEHEEPQAGSVSAPMPAY